MLNRKTPTQLPVLSGNQLAIFCGVLLACLFTTGTTARSAEAVLNANQIKGTIEFTNQNPEVLKILAEQGMTSAYVRAVSLYAPVILHNSTFPAASTPLTTSYEMSVEASSAGVVYQVSPRANLDGGREYYFFGELNSVPVQPEPAPDAIVNFREKIGLIKLNFIDQEGQPYPVGGNIRLGVWRQRTPGATTYDIQNWDWTDENSYTEYLAVRGQDINYRVDIRFPDQVISKFVTVASDEIVELDIVVPPRGDLGAISGIVDMEGEDEHRIGYLTRMSALNGPLGNYLWLTMTDSPSQGLFELSNLVPSAAETPPRNYIVRGEMGFRTGHRYEYFRTPWLYGPYHNTGVLVEAGQTTDLGDTFVMNPGYVTGHILLVGPNSGASAPALEDMVRDAQKDYDRNGIPDAYYLPSSLVMATGTDAIAAGATMSSWGGQAKVGFAGSYDPATDTFTGDYEMVLGGLKREPSVWRPDTLVLKFTDTRTPNQPETYQQSWLQIRNQKIGTREIAPQTFTEIDHSYCMSEVNLAFRSVAGTFYSPQVRGEGVFSGPDFQSNEADYSVSLAYAHGTPRSLSSATDQGLVAMTLPAGSYLFTPMVRAVNPSGSISNTELPPVAMEVGCRQIANQSTELQVSMLELPTETDQEVLTVSGSINSNGLPVAISSSVNEKPAVPVCSDCGPDPDFSFEVGLEAGDNRITVSAVNQAGDEASVTASIKYDPPIILNPPVLSGYQDINLEVEPGEAGAIVDFQVEVEGGCTDEVQLICEPPSGSFFLLGETQVTCAAQDTCGEKDQADFTVTVTERDVCADDRQSPLVTSAAETRILWPPNHNMVDVGFTMAAVDFCDGDISKAENGLKATTEVWSNEPELSAQGRGSGKHGADAKLTEGTLKLRSERSGKGDGRIYLIISRVTDLTGNTGIACGTVVVPKANNKKSLATINSLASAARDLCQANDGQAPADFFRHGVSGEIGPKQ